MKNFTITFLTLLCFFVVKSTLSAQGFIDVTVSVGIKNPLNPILPLSHDGHDPGAVDDIQDIGTGAAWLDFNNDGLLDLYVTMRTGANLLYQNMGYNSGVNDYTFNEVAADKGVDDPSHDGGGVSIADINNDGYVDLFLANVDGDRLFRNDGPPSYTFTDITLSSGLMITNESRGTSPSWGDYDGDGYLDLYITHHVGRPGNTGATNQDYLFHNDGDETFTDVSGLLGLTNLTGYGFIGGWVDIDKDNDLDLIVINDCDLANPDPEVQTHTRIFKNNGGLNWATWNFTQEAAALGVDDCRNGMGIAVGDYNRDGWMDFFYTNIGECVLFENDGDGTFTDVTSSAGVGGQNSAYYSWGCGFFDYNLDSYLDIIVAFGAMNVTSSGAARPNQLFENDGDGTYTEIAGDPGVNMDDDTKTRSAIFGDYDNDGDLDVFYMSYGEVCALKRNEHINDINVGNNWLKVKLVGDPAQNVNKDAVGSKLKLTYGIGNEEQYFETRSGSNLGGGDEMKAHFGLGSETIVSSLEITWPNGDVQVESGFGINQEIEVEQSSILPVELINFTGKSREHDILLEWATAIEIDNDHFKVQKSLNGRDFENIGTVFGNGTTSNTSYYAFVDENPFGGENYYRLKQFDKNGQSSYSPVILVRFPVLDPTVEVIPNPVDDAQINVRYNAPDDEVSLELFNVFGERFFSETLANDGNVYTKIINASSLAPGVYFVRISGRFGQKTTKVLIR